MQYKTQEEYNNEYTKLCAELGDRFIKKSALDAQIDAIQTTMKALIEESSNAAKERAKDLNSTTE